MAEDYSSYDPQATSYDPQVTSALWQQYANSQQNTPMGFQFNENQALANALYNYGQDPYLNPVTYMPGYEDTLTRKLLEKKDSGLATTQPRQQSSMSMPSMDSMQSMMGGGTGFGSAAGSKLPTEAATPLSGGESFGASGVPVQEGGWASTMGLDTGASSAATGGGGGLLDSGGSFGSLGSAEVGSTGGYATGADATGGIFGNMSNFGIGGGGTAAAYGGAAGGALAGYMQGRENYKNDPNMWSGEDGYGKYHKDYRAEVGGGTLGGVLGWYGGPIGAAVAGPAVKYAHKFMEPATRKVINFGDKVGGAGGALMLDPIGTVSTGKYSWGELGKGALLGPAGKWLGW